MAGLGSVNFGGMASGLDTGQIIDDLIKVESQPLLRLERQKSDLTQVQDSYTSMKSDLSELQNLASQLKTTSSFGVFSASSSDEEALTVSASSTANEGNYSIKILSLAQAETISGKSFDEINTDLGLSGEIIINNNSMTIRSSDSLIDIRNSIKALDVGVTASILNVSDSDNRLILTSDDRGEEGFRISNVGGDDLLGTLGFTDSTTSIRETDNGSVLSASFSSSSSTLGSLMDISNLAVGSVTIKNKAVAIDLSSDSLSSIRDKINGANIGTVTASIESVEVGDETRYRLAVSGTAEFTDDNSILESIGILEHGTTGTYSEFETVSLEVDGNGAVSNNTKLTNAGAVENETITVIGINADGSSVNETITISKNMTISDLMSDIESAYEGSVTASLNDGRINITSNVAGSNSLAFTLSAGNESGGTLDFGVTTTIETGRDRLLSEGMDARLLVNNIEVSRGSNEISNVLEGLNLTLKKADVDTVLNITVERDRETIKDNINGLVGAYNKYVEYVNANSSYDQDTGQAGTFNGELTVRTISSRVKNVLISTVFNDNIEYNQLVEIGIETTAEGKLDVDASKLDDALNADVDSVISLFTATRSSSDNDIEFVYHSTNTQPGTYEVEITTAAEMASVESDAFEDEVDAAGTITIQDNYDYELEVDFTEDMSLQDIANIINEESDVTYTEIVQSDGALTQAGSGDSITQNTSITDIDGVTVDDGDTITLTGITRSGKEYTRILELSSEENTTVRDILDQIENINNSEVIASVDTSGNLQFEDKVAGPSQIDLTIESTVDGLDFGDFSSTRSGRYEVNVSASVTEDDRLMLSSTDYGASKTITVSGASALGIADNEYAGIDVAGTINGIDGVGNGQSLSASTSNKNIRGIIIRSSLSASELALEGPSQGSITLVAGIADMLYSELSSLTNGTDGYLKAKFDSFDRNIDTYNDRIDEMNKRLVLKRAHLVQQYTRLEMEMARLQSMQQRLTSSLGSL